MTPGISDPVLLKCLDYQKEVTGFTRIYYPGWKNKSVLFSWENVSTEEERKAIESFLVENGFPGVILYEESRLEEVTLERGNELLEYGLLLSGTKEQLEKLPEIRKKWEVRNNMGLLFAGTAGICVEEPDWMEEEYIAETLRKEGFSLDLCGKYSAHSLDPLLRPDCFTLYPMILRNGELKEEVSARLKKYLETAYYSSPLSCCRIHTVAGKEPLLPEKDFMELLKEKKDALYLAPGSLFREYLLAWHSLRCSSDGKKAVNISSTELFLDTCQIQSKLPPGATLIQEGAMYENPAVRILPPEKIPYCDSMKEEKLTSAPDGTPFFPGGAAKALTFSYDDGGKNDPKFIAILDKYGMKGTFNLNACNIVDKMKDPESNWSLDIYKDHEIATHNFRHISFAVHPREQILAEIYWDRRVLEALSGRIITGHAYASSTHAGSSEIAREVLKAAGILYARVTSPAGNPFDLPGNWLFWEPTCHHSMQGDLSEKGEIFLKTDDTKMRLMYVWGHVAEFDRDNNYDVIEKFCEKMAADRERIFFGTNGEIADYLKAWEKCRKTGDGKSIKNTSFMTLFVAKEGPIVPLPPGKTVTFS